MDCYIIKRDGTYEKSQDIIYQDIRERRIIETVVRKDKHTKRISTVFLGIDHSFGSSNEPVLFETMVFDGDTGDGSLENRFSNIYLAMGFHKGTVESLKQKGYEFEEEFNNFLHIDPTNPQLPSTPKINLGAIREY